MRRDLLIIAVIVLAVILVVAVAASLLFGPASADILSVSTDKDLYHSNEIMHVTVEVSSSRSLDNTTLLFSGIEDRYGDFKLNDTLSANLTPGTNTLVYEHTMPSCSHCSGLDPGDYQFNVTLGRNGAILDTVNHTIRIEQ
ncbi:MAG: hypothetical protein LUQ61_05110 [Methanoregulaceae archaeon]|jgi:hypothetical protein|nr:hypothetical protein [Methanoregulaceae archaeon]